MMKDKKVVVRQFAFYDRTRMEAFLEAKALDGWKLVKTNLTVWRFERIEPQELKYSVNYFDKASQFDWGPTEEQQDFVSFCNHTGWELVAEKGEVKFFCNKNIEATPIDTDPITELASIKKSCRMNVEFLYGIYIFNGLIQFSFCVFHFFMNKINFMANNCKMLLVPWSILVLAISSSELIRYHVWVYKAERAAKEGDFVPTKGVDNMLIIGVASALIGVGLMWGGLIGGQLIPVLLLLAEILVGVVVCVGISVLMKKRKVAPKVNQLVTYILAGVVGVVIVFALLLSSEKALSNRTDEQSSLFLTVETDGCFKVEVKAKFLHNFVKKEMLKSDGSAYTIDVDGNVYYDEYVETDAVVFGVDEAYALCSDGYELGTYVLIEDNLFVRIRESEDCTKETMKEMFQ